MEHGFYSPSTGDYWQTAGAPDERYRAAWPVDFVEVPMRPSQYHEWDGSKWVDENAPDPLDALRATASLTRREFCIWLDEAGVLAPTDDLVAVSSGAWPVSMEPFLDTLAEAGARRVRIEWAAATTVERENEFVLLLIYWNNMDHTAVDAGFGITWQA